MSKYKVSNYIAKKWEDISKETLMYKAYELGIAQGMAWSYENLKSATDKEIADKIWRNYLDGTDELCIIFRTIVNLSNDDTNSKIEKLMERLSETKKPEKVMSDDEWNEFYMGDDGTMTYYIDMVERKFARSSTAAFDKRYDLLDSADDMFQKIVSE